MKKIVITVSITAIIFALMSTYYILAVQKNIHSEETLIKAFDFSGARVISSEVYVWGRLGGNYNTLEKLTTMADEITNYLGVKKNNTYFKNITENDNIEKIEERGINNDGNVVDINADITKEADSGQQRIITVSITEDLSYRKLEVIRERVTGIFKKYGIEPKVNSSIVGNYEGKLNIGKLNDICIRMLDGTEAKKVESMNDNNLISVSAYSPFIDDSISVNGKKVNLNLAIRYNSYENKTYIWLATPVITTEY